jgi:hypothetical protein
VSQVPKADILQRDTILHFTFVLLPQVLPKVGEFMHTGNAAFQASFMFLQEWIIVSEAPPSPPTNNVAHPTIAGFAILITTVMFGICVHIVDQLLSRQLSEASSEWRERYYEQWHPVFHWYPQACISALAGMGLGMVQVQRTCLCVFAFLWNMGCRLLANLGQITEEKTRPTSFAEKKEVFGKSDKRQSKLLCKGVWNLGCDRCSYGHCN